MKRLGCVRGPSGFEAQGGATPMRQWLLTVATVCALAGNTGCLLPIYSADPARRAQQLIYTSENFRSVLDEWERIWFLDQPSHLQPHSIHGGII
jgi:hypothetical protein